MKDLIRKILRESEDDDLDWISSISHGMVLSDYMLHNNININKPHKLHKLKVEINPSSRFYNEKNGGNPINTVGVIDVGDPQFNAFDELPIIVEWDVDGVKFTNSYSPDDLVVVSGNLNESEDDLEWIRDVKYVPFTLPLTEENIHQTLGFSFVYNEKWYTGGEIFKEYKDPRVKGRTIFEMVNIDNESVWYVDSLGITTSRTIKEFIHFVNTNAWIFLDHDGNYIFNNEY